MNVFKRPISKPTYHRFQNFFLILIFSYYFKLWDEKPISNTIKISNFSFLIIYLIRRDARRSAATIEKLKTHEIKSPKKAMLPNRKKSEPDKILP